MFDFERGPTTVYRRVQLAQSVRGGGALQLRGLEAEVAADLFQLVCGALQSARLPPTNEIGSRRGDAQASASHQRVWTAIGARQHDDQIRTLLCRGPRLLGWVGAVRDRPFERADVRRLASLTDALRARLVTKSAARTRLPQMELVDGLMAAILEPALLLGKWGHIEAANAAGLRLVEESRSELLPSLRAALACGRRHPAFALTRLASRGAPPYVLALYVEENFAQAGQVEAACRRWSLSGRLAAVLEQVVAGRSNKEISQRLGCAEVTVERHLTSLFRVTGARSRTELLCKVFVKPPTPASS